MKTNEQFSKRMICFEGESFVFKAGSSSAWQSPGQARGDGIEWMSTSTLRQAVRTATEGGTATSCVRDRVRFFSCPWACCVVFVFMLCVTMFVFMPWCMCDCVCICVHVSGPKRHCRTYTWARACITIALPLPSASKYHQILRFCWFLGLVFRDPPAVIRLTVYCWLHIQFN